MNFLGLLALIALWVGLSGPRAAHVVVGSIVALWALAVTGMLHARAPRLRLLGSARLVLELAIELVRSNLRVAGHVIRPRRRFRPAIVAVPLEPMSDAQIALLANMLTITPGTAAIDVSADRSRLYVHVLDARDPAAVVRDIKQGFERRIREASR